MGRGCRGTPISLAGDGGDPRYPQPWQCHPKDLGQDYSHQLTAPQAKHGLFGLGVPSDSSCLGGVQWLQHGENHAAQYPSNISCSCAFYLLSF